MKPNPIYDNAPQLCDGTCSNDRARTSAMEKIEQLEKFLTDFALEIEIEKLDAERGSTKRMVAISVLKTIGLVKDKIKEINEA